MLKRLLAVAVLSIFVCMITGCGETVTGVVKDAKRIGGGIRTIFVRD